MSWRIIAIIRRRKERKRELETANPSAKPLLCAKFFNMIGPQNHFAPPKILVRTTAKSWPPPPPGQKGKTLIRTPFVKEWRNEF